MGTIRCSVSRADEIYVLGRTTINQTTGVEIGANCATRNSRPAASKIHRLVLDPSFSLEPQGVGGNVFLHRRQVKVSLPVKIVCS
ncbi:hypothetical protein MHPYR_30192 [uncultured Mycobacterium sp.]|uniref:Uncharacterized protein n=1 Tax=uncultured Mycobacterium sp. TaxID=171292 RepID=A0A1Y5PBZ3_9MYCO|nr:hypothetical protein MHPYR_30192 [uncultured Mycobacterium sp.]